MQTLQDALARRGRGLRFDAPLEQAYERDTGASRGKRVFWCSLLGTVDFWLIATVDLAKLSHAATLLAHLRDSIFALCTVSLLWQWRRLKRLSTFEREWLTAFGAILMAGHIAVEVDQARDLLGVMIGINAMTIILFTCLIARLRFSVAVVVTVLTLVAYAVGAAAHDPLTEAITRNFLALFVGISALSLFGNHELERTERRAYLMQRLSLLNRAAAQAGAEALRKLTLHDPLTGLANRRHFNGEIGKHWHVGRRPGAPVGLLQIDVDFFKRYNDGYGHPMGDVCLQKIGATLREIAGSHGGLAARIGGEEFALLLPGLNLAEASAVAGRVCQAVQALRIAHRGSTHVPFVTVSVGVASTLPGEANDPAALMFAADMALYRAKREGRNRFAQAEAALASPAAGVTAPVRGAERPEPVSRPTRQRVEQLSAMLAAGQPRLRFPPAIESVYQCRTGLLRQRRLALLVLIGLAATVAYVALGLPLHADNASDLMRGTVILCGALALPWLAVWRRPIPLPWQAREWLHSATASLLLLGLLLLSARGQSPGLQSGVVSLGLVTIMSTVLAAPPVRFSLLPCALLCVGVAALTASSHPADRARWVSALLILVAISIYSLIGACLLDRSNRRVYLLRELSKAQIAELEDINADLQRLALTDALTGLPNRRHFESRLSTCWEDCRSTDAPLALLILDIDHFKAYNDGYGHLAGDDCLQSVGALISDWCASEPAPADPARTAFAARMGGEEFGVLLPGHDGVSALDAAERLCAGLRAARNPHAHSAASDVLTASIGSASQRPSMSADPRRLVQIADEALYRAKSGGRNRASC